jgi:predicted transcriptional regulator of viral defense system
MNNINRLKYSVVVSALTRKNISIFSVDDFTKLFKVTTPRASNFLARNSKPNSNFIKIKRGLYILTSNSPIKFEVANKSYQPSYISFATALSYYNIIPETVYTITSATTKGTKELAVQNTHYQYYKLKKELFFGYQPIKIQQKIVLMADKEKALLDYIYLSSLKKQPIINERMNLTKIDKNKLGYYVKFFIKNLRKSQPLIETIKVIYKSL